MSKREKWTKSEDNQLKFLISKNKPNLDWETISEQMLNLEINKSSKQCRERWYHQLDPELKKEKWTDEENKLLFELHKKIGSKWKEIAEFFKGRTDNCIKNQIFSLIRKSLRNARKILGKVSNTISINKIRPKILSDFLRKKINVVFPSNLKKKNLPNEKIVYMNDFVVRFVFNNLHQLLTKLDDQDVYVIEKSLEFLRDLNKNYLKKKKKIKKNKKKIPNNIINSNTKEKSIGFNKLNHNKNDKILFEKKKVLQKLDIDYKIEEAPLINSLVSYEKKKKEYEKVHCEYLLNPEKILNERKNFTENIKKIGEISYLMYEAINKSSYKDFEETFSSQSKKNKFTFLNNSNFLQKSETIEDFDFKNHLPERKEFNLSNIYLNKKDQSSDLLQSFINTNATINVRETNFSPSHFALSNSNVNSNTNFQNKIYDNSRFNNFFDKKFDQSESKMNLKFNRNDSNNISLNLFESQTSNFSNK